LPTIAEFPSFANSLKKFPMATPMTVLITGSTAGIGKATAQRFAREGHNVILTGRREERNKELADELVNDYGVQVYHYQLDVCERGQVQTFVDSLPQEWRKIDVLINNAGLAAGLSPVHEGDLDNWEQMIDTNVKGLLYLTRAVSPLMVEQEKGHIINIGSVAGFEVYPKGNVYSATKHAVHALTRSMRLDLLDHGIKVTTIAPGLVETEFSKVRFNWDEERADQVYEGYQPLTGDDVADAIYYAASRPAHVNINELVLTPLDQGDSTTVRKH